MRGKVPNFFYVTHPDFLSLTFDRSLFFLLFAETPDYFPEPTAVFAFLCDYSEDSQLH